MSDDGSPLQIDQVVLIQSSGERQMISRIGDWIPETADPCRYLNRVVAKGEETILSVLRRSQIPVVQPLNRRPLSRSRIERKVGMRGKVAKSTCRQLQVSWYTA